MDREQSADDLKWRMVYRIKRRKEEINNVIMERRTEIHRRIRHRRYLLHKLERMRTVPFPISPCSQSSNADSSDWWERVVLKEFRPEEWQERFHVSKDTFFLLCNKLKPQLEQTRPNLNWQTLPLEKRVAVALMRMSTNMEYCFISELIGVSITTVGHCVREVCEAIVLLLKPPYMHLPSVRELEDNAKMFHMQWGFPNCVGVLDSLHIPVKTPTMQATDCWNRKGWHSVVLQGVVNGQGCFWDVCVGFPGSTDDVTILQSSELWTMAGLGGLSPQPPMKLMGQPLGYLLLGDAAYPLQSWLLKCYPASPPLTPQQHTFNARMSQCRSVIENAFRRLKARWQCVHRRNDSQLDIVPMMALASCILHNVCEVHNDPFKEEWLEEVSEPECLQPNDVAPDYMDDPNAEEVRSLLCRYFHLQQQQPPPLLLGKKHLQSNSLCHGVPLTRPRESATPVELLTML